MYNRKALSMLVRISIEGQLNSVRTIAKNENIDHTLFTRILDGRSISGHNFYAVCDWIRRERHMTWTEVMESIKVD